MKTGIIPTIIAVAPFVTLFLAILLYRFYVCKTAMERSKQRHYDGDLIIGYSKSLGQVLFCDENIYKGLKTDKPVSSQNPYFLKKYETELKKARQQ